MISTIFLVFCLIAFIVGIAMRKGNPKVGVGTAATALVALLVGLVRPTP
jgi:hypothetical protein